MIPSIKIVMTHAWISITTSDKIKIDCDESWTKEELQNLLDYRSEILDLLCPK